MTLKLFVRKQASAERAARIVGSIYNAGAKPMRRFESNLYTDHGNAGELATRGVNAPVYTFANPVGQWSK